LPTPTKLWHRQKGTEDFCIKSTKFLLAGIQAQKILLAYLAFNLTITKKITE